MAYFALLWKARTIEIYRQNYESEKINSILMSKTSIPKQSLTQRWRHYRYDTQKRISRTFRRWYPEGSSISNLFLYLKTDQTFPNFVLKSVLGFVGGIVLTYLCFMFFVFQLSISLMHATIMGSIIGVLLTLGLAFSYRIRCLVFLLIPQFFSRVGRYTLTCYALVLILTGPATNTLKNSEVLSESMACGQEQIKTSVSHIKTLMARPPNSLKYSIPKMVDKLRSIAAKMKRVILKVNRLILSLSQVINTGYLWLNNLATTCNAKLGTPYLRCMHTIRDGVRMCKSIFGSNASSLCDVDKVLKDTCSKYNNDMISVFFEHLNGNPVPVIKKRLKNFTERIKHMFFMQVHVHHSYSFSSNTTRTASQVAAGIVTEIRKRADPLLTWLSWSSYVTSFFLLLIIFRAKNYQHMFETRSRFDNSYITKDIRILDLKRLRERRETILPLNRREQAKYVTTTSFRLVASEKAYLNRSVVFMAITTFKLLIHMIADYSLYWVLITIRHHGRMQTPVQIDAPNTGILVSGSGFTSDLLKSIVTSLGVLLESPVISPVSCLPNPSHPDFKRYTQIGVLIFLLWFFAMFEPYGLRLRHVVMGHYQPDRAKRRAVWLYNHILRARAGFMKLARRKLHRTYKYRSEEKLTIHQWLLDHIPFGWLRILLGITTVEPHCLLCGTVYFKTKPDTQLIRCKSLDCHGIYCDSCFTDIGELCTICLSPEDYGDLSDVSLEKGSSEDSDESDDDSELRKLYKTPNLSICEEGETLKRFPKRNNRNIFSRKKRNCDDIIPLISKPNYESDTPINDKIPTYVSKSTMKKAMIIRYKNKCDNKSHKKFYKYLGNHIDHGLKKKKNWKSIKDNNIEPCYAKVTKVYNDFKFLNQNNKQIVNKTNEKVHKMFYKRIAINQKKTNRRINTKHTKKLTPSNYSRRPIKASNFIKNITQCRFYRIRLASNSIKIDMTFKNNKVVTAMKKYYKPTCKCKMKRKGRLSTDFAKYSIQSPRKYHPKQHGKKSFANSILTFSCCSNNGHAVSLDSQNYNNKDSKINNKESGLKETNKARVASCYRFEKLRVLFCDYWRNIVACSYSKSQNSNRSGINDTTLSKERKDHKGRKKKSSKYEGYTSSDDARFKSYEVRNEENRKYRVSVFLSDQDWIRRQWNNIGTKMKTELSLTWSDLSDAVADMTSFQTKKKVDEKAVGSETIEIDVANKLKEEIHQTLLDNNKSIAMNQPATVKDICEKYGCDLYLDYVKLLLTILD